MGSHSVSPAPGQSGDQRAVGQGPVGQQALQQRSKRAKVPPPSKVAIHKQAAVLTKNFKRIIQYGVSCVDSSICCRHANGNELRQ